MTANLGTNVFGISKAVVAACRAAWKFGGRETIHSLPPPTTMANLAGAGGPEGAAGFFGSAGGWAGGRGGWKGLKPVW